MSDARHINFQQERRWGKQLLVLAALNGDDSYTVVQTLQKDYLVQEPLDQSGIKRESSEGESLFRFRLYGKSEVDSLNLNTFNLIVFAGTRYEVRTKERKRQARPVIEVTARPIGTE